MKPFPIWAYPMPKVLVEHLRTFFNIWQQTASSRDRIRGAQKRLLKQVLANAYNKVPYYGTLFRLAGIHPNDIASAEDLRHLPITSSREYRHQPLQSVLAEGVNREKLVSHHTSGSTGTPMTILRSPLEEHLINFFRMRAWGMLGMRMRDCNTQIIIPGMRSNVSPTLIRLRQKSGFYRRVNIDCFKPVAEILYELERIQAEIISGYPGVLVHIAAHVLNGASPKPSPNIVLTGGESLTPFRRERIEAAFDAPVWDLYGAHEFNLLAWNCRETGYYHVCDDNVIVEVLKNGSPAAIGEDGEVVVTGLHGYAMPFIRYNLGDIAVRGPDRCPCGSPFSTLIKIEGRVKDYFNLPDGRAVHPAQILKPVIAENTNWIAQYQIVQQAVDHIALNVCPLFSPDANTLNRMRRAGNDLFGEDVSFEIKLVDEFPSEPSGKFQSSKSLVENRPIE